MHKVISLYKDSNNYLSWFAQQSSTSGVCSEVINFAPRGHLAMFEDIFSCFKWRSANGIERVETREVTIQPMMHSTAPTTKDYPAQLFNNVEDE